MKRIIGSLALIMCLINAGCQKEPAKIAVEAITLNTTSISLTEGGSATVSASISPSNATNQKVFWATSNSAVATVEDGLIKAISAGNATVTAKSDDQGKTATCEVTVTPQGPLVDLGLSVKWASCNLGASKPEEYGGYYQWAGLEDVTSTSIYLDYSNCPYHSGSSSSTGWTKYVPSDMSSYWSGSGNPDNKTVLDPEDDVAHVKSGGKWRMPTKAECEELLNYCTSEWTTLNGIKGRKFTSKKNGSSIFLPAAGCRSRDYIDFVGSSCVFWSSSLRPDNPSNAYFLGLAMGGVSVDRNSRCSGRSVRPVSK